MKSAQYIGIKISLVILVFTSVICFLALYFVSGTTSFFEFLESFFDTFQFSFLAYGIALLWLYFAWLNAITNFLISSLLWEIEVQNKKLKDYNKYLAHELKTPIAIVQSNLDVLNFEYQKVKVTSSKIELKNMVSIIDWLLKYSESTYAYKKKEINLENFIKRYAQVLSNTCNITIQNKQFNKTVETDEALFGRVIQNLLQNACKYSQNREVLVKIQENSLIIENTVEFTLSPMELRNIFIHNYTLWKKSKTSHGIGLALTSEIVEWLGFMLNADSYDEKFRVTIDFL